MTLVARCANAAILSGYITSSFAPIHRINRAPDCSASAWIALEKVLIIPRILREIVRDDNSLRRGGCRTSILAISDQAITLKPMSDKPILVTGATGNISSLVIPQL